MLNATSDSNVLTAADVVRLTRQRQRLCLDYQIYARAKLKDHCGHTSGFSKAASKSFTALRRQFLSHYAWSPPRWRVWLRDVLKERALPDFCVIGSAKTGTSDLAITLMLHPNVLHPLVKEISSSDPLKWKPFYPTLKAVQRHARRHGLALCPYVAPALHRLDIPITLSRLRPQMKIVINLRNPMDLVFSRWKWSVLHTDAQLLKSVPFLQTFPAFVEKAIELFPEAPAPISTALHSGLYANAVAHWLRYFDNQNVRIFDIADYFKDRNTYFGRLEEFLGLPHIPLPQQLPVANRNPLEELTAPLEASAKLKVFFEPYNLRLWDVIGARFSW